LDGRTFEAHSPRIQRLGQLRHQLVLVPGKGTNGSHLIGVIGHDGVFVGLAMPQSPSSSPAEDLQLQLHYNIFGLLESKLFQRRTRKFPIHETSSIVQSSSSCNRDTQRLHASSLLRRLDASQWPAHLTSRAVVASLHIFPQDAPRQAPY
jgi:hypothetical protein